MRIGHRSVPGPRLSTPLHAVPAITLGILASVLAPIANAGLPEREQAGSGTGTVDIDRTTRVDANRIDMSTTNHGSFGYDIPNGDAGLIYPRSGQNTALFAGGLWIGALVNDSDLRISLAEYSFEYIPGRIEPDGSWDTNYDSNPRWRTYKIYRGDLPGSNPDYDERSLAPFRTNWWYCWAEPLSCLVMVLIAAPLGIVYSRRGVLGGVAASIVIFALIYVLSGSLVAAGQGGYLPPVVAAWGTDFIFASVGAVLLWARARNRELPTPKALLNRWKLRKGRRAMA